MLLTTKCAKYKTISLVKMYLQCWFKFELLWDNNASYVGGPDQSQDMRVFFSED